MELNEYEKIHKLQISGWWFGMGRNKIIIDILKESMPNLHGCKLLDVGCSEGAFLDHLNQEKADFVAVDIDENAVRFYKECSYHDRVKYGNVLDLPFDDNSFDAVTALDIIEHVEDDVKALSEIKRVCKKNGTLLIILPAHQWLWSSNDIAYHHKRRYSKKMVKELIHKLNLKIDRLLYFNVLLFPIFILATFYKKIFLPDELSSNVTKPVPKTLNYVLSKLMNIERVMIKYGITPFGSSFIIVIKNT